MKHDILNFFSVIENIVIKWKFLFQKFKMGETYISLPNTFDIKLPVAISLTMIGNQKPDNLSGK